MTAQAWIQICTATPTPKSPPTLSPNTPSEGKKEVKIEKLKILLGVREMEEDRIALAKSVETIREELETIASVLSLDFDRDFRQALEMLKFASKILNDEKRILDASYKFSSLSSAELVDVEAEFAGVVLCTGTFTPEAIMDAIRQRFTQPEIVTKAALTLLAAALSRASAAVHRLTMSHS
jgi:hypothetical protein